jgi:DNA phosphorothioation system restriction enzyme
MQDHDMLTDLDLKLRYRSSEDDLLEDFFLPCFREATSYSRAVGYFSSYALATAADGLPAFIEHEGTMRLVASPDLSDEDVEAIELGYRARDEVVEAALLRVLKEEQPDPIRERLGFLAWLVAHKRLDIKIAVVETPRAGIYHEKIGIFADSDGALVAFQGSGNESRGGLVANFESLLVFRSSLRGQAEIARTLEQDFERLWVDRTPRLVVMSFPEAAAEELLTRYQPTRLPISDHAPARREPPRVQPAPVGRPVLPAGKPLRDYQREALAAWFRNEGRGMLQMATGTGKTITALALLTKLYDALQNSHRTLAVIIICPFQHLVSQWGEEATRFNLDPVLCFRSRQTWFDTLAGRLDECRHGDRDIVVAIATYATFQTDAFQHLLGDLPEDTLFVADEVHNVGAIKLRGLLPARAGFRLGLSATPERWYDDEGTDALAAYFGPVVYELGLEAAIALGALTPYDYHPVVVELGGEELERYLDISAKIAMRFGQSDDVGVTDDPVLEMLLIKRARILSLAEGKLDKLEQVMRPLVHTTHNLFYCGDGEVEYEPAGETVRQLDAVVHLLGHELGMSVNSYTAETYLDERTELRRRFASGRLQGLVAIRCLDEGVDIPETERAFILASSTNPRQFIQRRGRILRLHAGKEKATIVDFIVVPPSETLESAQYAVERRLVRRELERVALFARLARNGPAALGELESLRKQYDLLHVA